MIVKEEQSEEQTECQGADQCEKEQATDDLGECFHWHVTIYVIVEDFIMLVVMLVIQTNL